MKRIYTLFITSATILIIAALSIQQVHARSLVGSYSDGYEAGKEAAKAGNADVCDGSGTIYCTGFHVGWNAAALAEGILRK
jgi:hypothetical protein